MYLTEHFKLFKIYYIYNLFSSKATICYIILTNSYIDEYKQEVEQ